MTLKETIILTASYYGRTLSEPVLNMYADDLQDLPVDLVIEAYRRYRRNPKNTQFPLPAQIRGIVAPEVDPDSAAREIAARITAAIPKFGWCNSNEARAYIGEVGWAVVERQGGWMYLCQHHGLELDPTAFQAQARELAKSQIVHSPAGMAKAIGLWLAPGTRHGELQSIKEIMSRPDKDDTEP